MVQGAGRMEVVGQKKKRMVRWGGPCGKHYEKFRLKPHKSKKIPIFFLKKKERRFFLSSAFFIFVRFVRIF